MIKEQIKDALEQDYSRDNWVSLIRNVFNNGSFNAKPVEISIAKNDIAENAFEIGSFETVDERIIGIYEIKIKKNVNLERNRVGLRQLLRSVYKQVDGALIVFDQGKRWRFSYVSEINSRDENGKLIKSQTEPKRFTYLFGAGTNNRTAIDRFFKLTGKPVLLEGIKEAFSVDALTKEFYKELSDWYFWALQHVEFPNDEEKDKDIRNSTNTIRLITRIMFVWFLKQKGLIPEELFIKEELDKIIKYNDKKDSTYYKAILQNLFFATLNTEMGDSNRKFVDRQYGIQGYYRYKRYFKDADYFLDMTKNVPFLNGGLFENLDKNVGTKDEKRIDCFSNRIENESRVTFPDYLFFGDETVDLSAVYDDKKRDKVEVHGLINILKKYNFTIEENTPLDVEVALDPELLGKVFENLLASYNTETKSTARKQTGSFYTPREVVEYMVDESLKAYLLQNLLDIPSGYVELGKKQVDLLGNEAKKGQLSIKQEIKENDSQKERYENLLVSLLSYSDDKHDFNEKEIGILISALDNCKILDPACGSGAFPMGALHKMVHVLHKLDPKNKLWKEKQIVRVKNAREAASLIQELSARDNLLIELDKTEVDIEKAFANNELDYGRKLYLIENCIYGVDLQPVAVQIAKLRFFISLVVDQNIHDKEDNLGIRPLPNLETKFVAANTLIALEKENNNLFTNPEIEKKKAELKRVRLDHFEAKTPGRKTRLRKQDEELRARIAELLVEEHELQPKAAKLLANWNPYDQNANVTFFDSEWMFGLTSGFDIVIGNPPYISYYSNTGSQLTKEEREYFLKNYSQVKKLNDRINCMNLFLERGLKLLNEKGHLSYITNKTIAILPSYVNVREYVVQNAIINYLITDLDPFDAIVDCVVFGMSNQKPPIDYNLRFYRGQMEKYSLKENSQINKNLKLEFHFSDRQNILSKIENAKGQLDELILINRGVNIGGCFDHFLSKEKKNSEYKEYLSGTKCIDRYHYEWIEKDGYMKFDEAKEIELREKGETLVLGNKSRYLTPRLIIPESGQFLMAAYCDDEIYTGYGLMIGTQINKSYSLKYTCALLNSTLMTFYATEKEILRKGNKATPHVGVRGLNSIPVPLADTKIQNIIEYFVDIISYLKNNTQDSPTFKLMVSFFERIINGIIYELYFSEEMKSNKCTIISELLKYDLKKSTGNNESIETLFKTIYESSNPIRVALFKMDIVEEIAVIEGKKK